MGYGVVAFMNILKLSVNAVGIQIRRHLLGSPVNGGRRLGKSPQFGASAG